ncbi:hypothetical protein V6O07_04895 [Arthrospira platensis SPKY2]
MDLILEEDKLILSEEILQEQIVLLSSFISDIKITREVAYKAVDLDYKDLIYSNKNIKPKSRRFDLIYKDDKAKSLFFIEVKKNKITALTITEIIAEKGYIEIIENIKEDNIQNKQLILTNPRKQGLTIGAYRLIKNYNNISYIPIEEIGETLFKCYKIQRIKENSWRDDYIRNKFKLILD